MVGRIPLGRAFQPVALHNGDVSARGDELFHLTPFAAFPDHGVSDLIQYFCRRQPDSAAGEIVTRLYMNVVTGGMGVLSGYVSELKADILLERQLVL